MFLYGGRSWNIIFLTFTTLYLSFRMVDLLETSYTWILWPCTYISVWWTIRKYQILYLYDIALTYLYGGRSCNITAASLRQAFHLQLFAANLRLFSICDSFVVRLRFVYSLSFKGTAKKPQGNCKCDLSHICSPIAVCLLLVCSSGCN